MLDRDPLLVGLGAAVRDARIARRMSQEQLGLETGIHRNYVGGIERGERNPSVMAVIRLATALALPVSALFERAERASES